RAVRLLAEISKLKRICPRRAGAHRLPAGTLAVGDELDQAWQTYEQELAARGLFDLDDLVGLAVELLESQPEVRNAAQRRHRYVSIDEYQDIDERQYRMVRALVPPG